MGIEHTDLGLTAKDSARADGCCGGGSCMCGQDAEATAQPIVSADSTDFVVNGMTCDHCVQRVSKALGEIAGVTGVTIDLHAGGASPVHIVSDGVVDRLAVQAAVEQAGYTLA